MSAASVLILLLAVLPAAAAAASVRGHVAFSSEARVAGAVTLSDAEGGLDLAPALRTGEPFTLAWSRAQGKVVTIEWLVVRDPTGDPSSLDSPPREEVLDLGEGTLRGVSCSGDCALLVVAIPGQGSVSLMGNLSGPLTWTRESALYWAHWSEGQPGSFTREFPAGALAASARPFAAGPTTILAQARPGAEGRVGVFLTNVTVEVETAQGRRTLDTLPRSTPVGGAGSLARVEKVESRFIYFEAEDASLQAPENSAAVLLAPRPRLALEGALHATRASGWLSTDGASTPFEDAALAIKGDLALRLQTRETPLGGLEVAPSLGARRLHADVQGEATRVQVGRASLVDPLSEGAGLATATGGLATLAALLWLLQRGALGAFYTRISRSRVLNNENRRRLDQLVRERPGRTTADLARESGLARVVVKHHLRMLEAHRLVATRRDGRRRRHFPAEAPGPDEAASFRLLLEDANRRKVAEALAGAPDALTQKQLARLTGLSQRVVSYHLSRLADARVVRVEGGMPRRYAFERAALDCLARIPSAEGQGAGGPEPSRS